MRWPWMTVRRHEQEMVDCAAEHEALCGKRVHEQRELVMLFRARLEEVEDERDYLRAESKRLYEQLLSMKKEGYTVVPGYDKVETPELPVEVLEAIKRVTDPDTPGYRHTVREAWAMKDAGLPVAEMVDRITRGEQVDV